MTESYDFVKEESGEWFIVLPDYPGEKADLQMVAGADLMLDHLLSLMDNPDKGMVNLIISDGTDVFNDHTLYFIEEPEHSGAIYFAEAFGMHIWLCDVVKFIFGEFPKSIYFSVNSI